MSPRYSMLAVGLGLTLAACAHKQEVPVASHPAAPPPAQRTQRAAVVVVAPAPLDTSKNKEGDAIFFDFDSAVLRDDARPVLQGVAEQVRGRNVSLQIEGNCDELGTVEYNIALGDHRARAAREYLVHMGVSPKQIDTMSYGSQRPKYPGHDETARAKNRRDDFRVR